MTPSDRTAPRDLFLDAVRAAATVRVVVWHATGAAWVTLVAAMPLMFFVSGHLYAGTLRRRGARATVTDRLRRLALPLWVFGAVSWSVMAIAAVATATGLEASRLPFWFAPVLDPQGSAWEQGWLSTPLWYMRVLLQLIVIAPLLIAAARRWPVVTVLLGGLGVIVLDHLARTNTWTPAFDERFLWHMGDLALYGTFFVLGALYDSEVSRRRGARVHLALAGVLAGGAAIWWALDPPSEGIVNNSHPLHLLIGGVWVALALGGAEPIRRAAARAGIRSAVRWFSQRAFTVYLWHTSAIAIALFLVNVGAAQGSGRNPLWWVRYSILIVALTAVLVLAWGWVEDLSARRRPRMWPRVSAAIGTTASRAPRRASTRVAVASLLGASVVAMAMLVPSPGIRPAPESAQAFRPRVPSQAPPLPSFQSPAAGGGIVDGDSGSAEAGADDDLQARLQRWADARGVVGAAVAVNSPDGATTTGAVGRNERGDLRAAEDQIQLESVTKLFTANLVYRAVDAGLIDLDAPLPAETPFEALSHADRLTARQLLAHRSGLVNYRDTIEYHQDPESIVEPIDAVVSSIANTAEADLGVVRYSSTNYLVLGLLLEKVTGREFGEMLRTELLEPLGLNATSQLPSEPGEPRFSTGGMVSDLGDVVRAGAALLRDHIGISEGAYQTMSALDPGVGISAGTMGYCPCAIDEAGEPRAFGIGYAGGDVLLVYVPTSDLVVAVAVTGGLSGDAQLTSAMDLVQAVAHGRLGPRATAPPAPEQAGA